MTGLPPNDQMDQSGVLEGFWSLDDPLDTPDIMRDCIRERYWEKPERIGLFTAARRLADDLKRRGCPQQKALEIISGRLISALNLLRPDNIKQIEKAVKWVYEKQEHGLSCTGALVREGVCFLIAKGCRFHDLENERRKVKKESVNLILPPELHERLKTAHPSEAIYAEAIYSVLVEIEQERNLIPGDEKNPIFVGFRAIADRVRVKIKAPGFNKHTAVAILHLLEQIKAIRKVINGNSNPRKRKANGYIRVRIPVNSLSQNQGTDNGMANDNKRSCRPGNGSAAPSPTANDNARPPHIPISPKYNPCVRERGSYMCPEPEVEGLA